MRNQQGIGFYGFPGGEKKQIDIDNSRTVRDCLNPPEVGFDLLCVAVELFDRKVGLDKAAEIEKIVLIGIADRGCNVSTADQTGADMGQLRQGKKRPVHIGDSVADIGSETECDFIHKDTACSDRVRPPLMRLLC